MKKIKTILLILIPVLAVLGFGGYYFGLAMQESARFQKDSIQYRLLTPDILKNMQAEKIGKVRHYYYSAADGNKPLINAIELESDKDRKMLEAEISTYFVKNGFSEIKPGELKKGDQSVSITYTQSTPNTLEVSVAVLEVIK